MNEEEKKENLHDMVMDIIYSGELESGLRFLKDTGGDSDNLTYGGIHSYSVPNYRREGGVYHYF